MLQMPILLLPLYINIYIFFFSQEPHLCGFTMKQQLILYIWDQTCNYHELSLKLKKKGDIIVWTKLLNFMHAILDILKVQIPQ